jgi:DNA-binding SARP family transcriptional activator
MAITDRDKLVVQVLGVTSVSGGDLGPSPVPVVGVKPRQILGMLAVRLGQPVAKDELAERLWEGSPPRAYIATLDSYICVLRRQLRTGDARKALATASRGYLLDPAHADVDVDRVRSQLGESHGARPGQLVTATEEALAHVGGTLLASEPYAAWAVDERRRFQELLVNRCVAAATAAQSLGEHDVAEQLAARALGIDALTEQAWVLRMQSLAATARRLDALRCYSELRRVLGEELGMEPGPQAQSLYLSLLREESRQSADPTQEVETLLGLLRRALEQVPGLRVPEEDRRLSAVAAELVGAA